MLTYHIGMVRLSLGYFAMKGLRFHNKSLIDKASSKTKVAREVGC